MVSGGCRELVVIWEQGLESKLRAGLRGPCELVIIQEQGLESKLRAGLRGPRVPWRELGLCSVVVLPHP